MHTIINLQPRRASTSRPATCYAAAAEFTASYHFCLPCRRTLNERGPNQRGLDHRYSNRFWRFERLARFPDTTIISYVLRVRLAQCAGGVTTPSPCLERFSRGPCIVTSVPCPPVNRTLCDGPFPAVLAGGPILRLVASCNSGFRGSW